ncbi:hypothetical protein [Herbaspirillum sp. RV1423]|uniref:hypothetical protein n=1 Tax=Herbaspirillum sp. RV1423 TaxID=1443993 RepID=UPI0012DDF8B0|nr:hypothetical protein [Herbaspirillum sp. RV1423]
MAVALRFVARAEPGEQVLMARGKQTFYNALFKPKYNHASQTRRNIFYRHCLDKLPVCKGSAAALHANHHPGRPHKHGRPDIRRID